MSIMHKEKQCYKSVTAPFVAIWLFTFSHFSYFRSSSCQAKDKREKTLKEHKRFTQAYWDVVNIKAFQICLIQVSLLKLEAFENT